MSTERPDNDATDPVGSHAEGPAEKATGPAPEDTAPVPATEPAGERAEDTAAERPESPAGDRAENTAAERAADLADDTAAPTAADSAEGSAGERSGDAGAAPAEDRPEDAAPDDPAEGPAGERGEDAGAESATEVVAPAEVRPEDASADRADGSAGDLDGSAGSAPAADRPEGAVADAAEGSAGERSGDAGAAPAEDAALDPAEGSAAARGVGAESVRGEAEGTAGQRAEAPGGGAADRGLVDADDVGASGARGTLAGSGDAAGATSGETSPDVPAAPAAPAVSEGSPGAHPEVAVLGAGSGSGEGDGAGGGRRRRSPVLVASVVAAVLLVGGGGALVATTASDGNRSGTPGADGTPPPLALDGYVASTTGDGSTGGTAGIAPGEPNPYGTTYRASGTLPAGPGSAHVQWAEGRVTRAEVARLAKALGLAGTPRLAGDAWTVGIVKDGTEPNLRVTADAPGTWTYASGLPGGDNCVKVTTCPATGPGSSAGSAPGPVSEAAAKRAAAPVLKAVGQDDAKLDASQLMDRVRVVNADPVVGGLPTYGWTTGLRIGTDGHVVGGSGQLKTPVEGDAYPVLGARKALDAMNASATGGDHRMGIGGCASPVPLKDRDEAPCEHPSPGPRTETVTVEKATFGLAAQRANGRQALVPSWLFEVRSPGAQDTYTVTHPAVDPAFLAPADPPAQPSAEPTVPAPSGEPSSPVATRDVGVQGYTAEGRDLTVGFTGGVCADYTVTASESPGKVTVTVTEKPWKNKVCIMIAKIYEKTVRLDEPLDGREVVGSDGKAVHQGLVEFPEASSATSAGPR
ncbi:hypothetical protein AB0F46_22800 [Streptomyces sp. NPDC026665]|uniref:hypothetical protein n=1 Tax=Streptomyces sp. NPDC026665 TaxID=3154798 RepID=UPI0033D6315F